MKYSILQKPTGEPSHGRETRAMSGSRDLLVVQLLDALASLLLGVGILGLASPIALYWWIHGDYNRYIWIIHGPFPYSAMGSGPFQLWMSATLFLSGAVLLTAGLLLKRHVWSKLLGE